MDLTYEQKYHQLEEQHWWFTGRRDAVRKLIHSLQIPASASILEIGCSAGPLQQILKADGYQRLTGIDISENAIALAKERGIPNVSVMDGAQLEFADASFDLLIASDVLEHIEDEERAVREWSRVLRPGGRMIVFVPAFQMLWTRHDEVNHHFRRYTGAHLRGVLQKAGLHLERSSYWNSTLFFPTSMMRLAKRILPRPATTEPTDTGDLKQFPGWINSALSRLLKTENTLLKHAPLPVGVSVFAIARKP
ncbi:class I SAM-dependent DNA methyltransferase [Hymenobacter psychrotolerans]|uniref:Methyltransferase domain-containing protein n=1 Tax=Hymenobacter psychrotolerans DSM 18569 TaxID=1121959 RepID=A0A1M6PSR6_9BACT|nr:class I SAM-dependent methyltransferase [Hymenobacter psychrotolerans]SHK11024.1 Methyltransferase domain-containing protein [Hymenobacter psychrotolerans DSM 18569]